MGEVIGVAVVDDDDDIRRVYREFLVARPDFEWVGDAADGRAGVDLFWGRKPDVTLVDLQMPVMTGVEAIREICSTEPRARLIALTVFGDSRHVAQALSAGACGYLRKDCSLDAFAEGIHAAAVGNMTVSAEIQTIVASFLRKSSRAFSAGDGFEALSQREVELLAYLAQGKSNEAISKLMYISVGGVKQSLYRIGKKFGVRGRGPILVEALRYGIVDPDLLPFRKR